MISVSGDSQRWDSDGYQNATGWKVPAYVSSPVHLGKRLIVCSNVGGVL
jgi:hypothetical protein